MHTATPRLMPLAQDIDVAEVGELLNTLGLKTAMDAGPGPGTVSGKLRLAARIRPKLYVLGPDAIVRPLLPFFPAHTIRLNTSEELVHIRGSIRPKHLILCSAPAAEDDLYAEVVGVLGDPPGVGWHCHRLFADVVASRLAGCPALSGPLAPPAIDRGEYRPYVILCTGRSGSSYLCDLLTNTGVCGFPKEHLRDPMVYCLKHGLIDASELVRRIALCDVTPNKVFGTKVISRYLIDLLECLEPGNLRDLLPSGLRVVYLSRTDKVAQAVSVVRAKLTGQWHAISGNRQHNPPPVARLESTQLEWAVEEYDLNLKRQHRLDELVELMFSEEQILRICYEDLVGSPSETLRQVMQHIGVHQTSEVDRVESRYKKIPADDRLYQQVSEALEEDQRLGL